MASESKTQQGEQEMPAIPTLGSRTAGAGDEQHLHQGEPPSLQSMANNVRNGGSARQEDKPRRSFTNTKTLSSRIVGGLGATVAQSRIHSEAVETSASTPPSSKDSSAQATRKVSQDGEHRPAPIRVAKAESSQLPGDGLLEPEEEPMGDIEEWMHRNLVIHPEKRFHFWWTICLTLVLLYVSIAVPLQMGFRYNASKDDIVDGLGLLMSRAWVIVEVFVDIFFILDFFLNFFTGYVDKDAIVQLRPRKTASKYAGSGWFWLDLVTSFPYDWVAAALISDEDEFGGSDKIQILKVFRGLKTMKILRINKLLRGNVLEIFEDLVASSSSMRFLIKMTKITTGMAFILHWMSCGLHLVADPRGRSWIREYFEDRFPQDDYSTLDLMPMAPRYAAALYWTCTTMSSVGYGDIIATTDGERLFAIGAMIIGGSCYGFLIGNMVTIVTDVDANTRKYNERMETILSYMAQRHFPPPLQRKIKKFYRSYFNQKSALDEKTVLAELSTNLKNEVALFLVNDLVFTIELFKDLPPSNIAMLAALITPVFFDKEDSIVHVWDEITDIHIIAAGTAAVTNIDGDMITTVSRGGSFGEEGLTGSPLKRPIWNVSVAAITVCENMTISILQLKLAFKGSDILMNMRDKAKKLPTLSSLAEPVSAGATTVAAAFGIPAATSSSAESAAPAGGKLKNALARQKNMLRRLASQSSKENQGKGSGSAASAAGEEGGGGVDSETKATIDRLETKVSSLTDSMAQLTAAVENISAKLGSS